MHDLNEDLSIIADKLETVAKNFETYTSEELAEWIRRAAQVLRNVNDLIEIEIGDI